MGIKIKFRGTIYDLDSMGEYERNLMKDEISKALEKPEEIKKETKKISKYVKEDED